MIRDPRGATRKKQRFTKVGGEKAIASPSLFRLVFADLNFQLQFSVDCFLRTFCRSFRSAALRIVTCGLDGRSQVSCALTQRIPRRPAQNMYRQTPCVTAIVDAAVAGTLSPFKDAQRVSADYVICLDIMRPSCWLDSGRIKRSTGKQGKQGSPGRFTPPPQSTAPSWHAEPPFCNVNNRTYSNRVDSISTDLY